ncbi:DUF4124 domain-containing protein, partial [Herbaspirillum sp. 3C11]
MKSFVFIVLPGLLCAVIAHAAPVQDEVYVCVDQNGVTEYRNTGLNKGCRKLDMPAA